MTLGSDFRYEKPFRKLQSVQITSSDGLNLFADQGGSPTATPVILLHGGGQTRFSWSRAAGELIDCGYQVLSPDLRGHGESQWSPNGSYELDDYIDDLRALMDSLPLSPVLVGAPLGGVVSLIGQGEQKLPEALALVLVDVVPRLEAAGVQEVIDFMSANPDGFASVEEAADSVASYIPHRKRTSGADGLLKNLRQRDDGRYYWHWDPGVHANSGSGEPMEKMSQRMEQAAVNIEIPTLVVRGGKSRVVSPEGVKHLAELIPHANYVDVAEAGHMVAGDRNDEFNAVIRRFLGEAIP
jgi:pimeloyl-ACP methyl ester carboxylesterase